MGFGMRLLRKKTRIQIRKAILQEMAIAEKERGPPLKSVFLF
jgi:hypothetical protein